MSTRSRKSDHIRINARENVGAKGISSGFEEYAFVNRALPEIDLRAVNVGTSLLGRKLGAPILISCMTGGTPEAREINRTLASVAQSHRFAMGLGSGRALLEEPGLFDTFDVRPVAPDVLLLANLGAVQLNKGYAVDDCRRLVELLQADALVLHLNALQEALQPGGDTTFSGLLEKISALCTSLGVPVVVKEVGWGIGPDCVRELFEAGVSAVDVAGAGGTSWSEVERLRTEEPWRKRVAAAFGDWGIPTAECLRAARQAEPGGVLIASGGIRTGLDIAKALALGADAAGVAGPFLRAAISGYESADELAKEYVEILRVAMFAIGVSDVAGLRNTQRIRRIGEPFAG